MEGDTIFFVSKFRSFDIKFCANELHGTFSWTERSQHEIKRSSFSRYAMSKICNFLVEASQVKGKHVRRWRVKERFSECLCAKIYNNQGRFFSIINIQGKKRTSMHIPELEIDSGWRCFAAKILAFLNATSIPFKKSSVLSRLVDPQTNYSQAVKHIKWADPDITTKGINGSGPSIIIEQEAKNINTILEKSLLASIPDNIKEVPSLSEMRLWMHKNWKNSKNFNIYEMGWSTFLIECNSPVELEAILEGFWMWKKYRLEINKWNPSVGAISAENPKDFVWVRAIGLPLHLWSQEVFQAIGDKCGGWIETEEETELRNHLKWARFLVKGDGSKVPKEITLEKGGFEYTIQLWTEAPARITRAPAAAMAGSERVKEKEEVGENRWMTGPVNQKSPIASDHVGTSKEGGFLNYASCEEHMPHLKFPALNKVASPAKKLSLGPNLLAQPFFFRKGHSLIKPTPFKQLGNLFIQKNFSLTTNTAAVTAIEASGSNGTVQDSSPAHANLDLGLNLHDQRLEEAVFDISQELQNPLEESPILSFSPPIPDYSDHEEDDRDSDEGMNTPIWIHQYIYRMIKAFGDDFEGCEDLALNLCLKIDSKRQQNKKHGNFSSEQNSNNLELIPVTPRNKGRLELRNLRLGSGTQFVSRGSRSKGGFHVKFF